MSEEIFRVDKFVVPEHAREEFLNQSSRDTRGSGEPRLVLCEKPSRNKRLVRANSTS
jgi:hypothetical protein